MATPAAVPNDAPDFGKRPLLTIVRDSWQGATTRRVHLASALLDLLFIGATGIVAAGVLNDSADASLEPLMKGQIGLLYIFAAFVVLSGLNYGLYQRRRMRPAYAELAASVKSVLLATAFGTASAVLFGSPARLQAVFVLVLGLTCALELSGWRMVRIQWARSRIAAGVGARKVLIVGTGATARELARYFDTNRDFNYAVVGFIGDHPGVPEERVLGNLSDLSRVTRAYFIDEIHIAEVTDRKLLERMVDQARQQRVDVKYVTEWLAFRQRAALEYFGALPVLALHREETRWAAFLIKRAIDITGALAGLLLTAPLQLAIAVAIQVDSKGSVLYCADRMGLRGRRFTFYKFRTMVADAEARKDELRQKNERDGPFFKLRDDPRITRLGHFLRKYSLDELPQLWNVLRGDMSLVGPRPHPMDDYSRYKLEHLRRLDVMPGITGLWQITARHDASFERSMELDLAYIEKRSPMLDLKILFRTLPTVLRGSGT